MQANWMGRLCFFFRQKSGVIALSFPFSQQEMDGLPFLLNRQKDRQTDRQRQDTDDRWYAERLSRFFAA